jgi:hypothetical protein
MAAGMQEQAWLGGFAMPCPIAMLRYPWPDLALGAAEIWVS